MLAKVSRSELSDGDNLISNFWNLEAIGITDSESANSAIVEDPAEHYFESTVQFENGRYQVKLPWKVDHPELPTNEDLAVARLKNSTSTLERVTGFVATISSSSPGSHGAQLCGGGSSG